MNAVLGCNYSLESSVTPNRSNIIVRKSRFPVALSRVRCAMNPTVQRIFGPRCPPKMIRIDTRSIAARMRGIMLLAWWFAVHNSAHQAICLFHLASEPDLPISAVIFPERPKYTIFTLESDMR
jgi:hypothetical protein